MPIDLPPVRPSPHQTAPREPLWLGRTLNWAAFVVGIGLCFWAVKVVQAVA